MYTVDVNRETKMVRFEMSFIFAVFSELLIYYEEKVIDWIHKNKDRLKDIADLRRIAGVSAQVAVDKDEMKRWREIRRKGKKSVRHVFK